MESTNPAEGTPAFQPPRSATPAMSLTPPPFPPALPPRRGRRLGWWLGFLLIGVPLLMGCVLFMLAGSLVGTDSSLSEHYHSRNKHGTEKIAIISVEGTILNAENGFVKQQIDAVREDKNVRAIVLRVDSPGGTVTGSDYIYHHLNKLCDEKGQQLAEKVTAGKIKHKIAPEATNANRLPLVVSMGGMAASGGYYVSMACGTEKDVIYAEPTTWTGSIGVIIPHYNFGGLMERFDVEEDSVKSHPLKQMGAPTRKMTEQERAIFQELVDDSFTRFKEIIKSGRPAFREKPEDLNAIATGQVFTTNQAMANGLVDKEGFIEEAIDRAAALAGLDKDDVKVVHFKRPIGLFDSLIATQSQARQRPAADLSALLDLTAPRAYFLCTWLPKWSPTGE